MGDVRAFSRHVRWTPSEILVLVQNYASTPRANLSGMLPGRQTRAIECKANSLGLSRPKKPKRTREEYLCAKREGMARRWATDPEGMRAKSRSRHHRNGDANRRKMREYTQRRFFWSRANKVDATAHELAALWKSQRGLCALTGRKLDRTAQLDHILPRARGGCDEIGNLRWVCNEANLAKRDLTDAEFAVLCSDVMSWIGRRIELVEVIQ